MPSRMNVLLTGAQSLNEVEHTVMVVSSVYCRDQQVEVTEDGEDDEMLVYRFASTLTARLESEVCVTVGLVGDSH